MLLMITMLNRRIIAQSATVSCNVWEQLTAILPDEQRRQLAEILLRRLAEGWGTIEIEVQDHHIKVFREVTSIPAQHEIATEKGIEAARNLLSALLRED